MDQNLLLCPVCGSPLRRVGNTARCENAHAFDYAKEGYLNLLAGRRRAGASSGDSREMALSRRVFLEKGYFAPLRDSLASYVEEHCGGSASAPPFLERSSTAAVSSPSSMAFWRVNAFVMATTTPVSSRRRTMKRPPL